MKNLTSTEEVNTPLPKEVKGIPRRISLENRTLEEEMLHVAVRSIENLGADPLLTDITVLLQDAINKLADYLEAE